MKVENYAALEFPSRSANEGFARAAAACFAAQLDPTLEEINDIKTAVSEAVTNAIVHAYPDRLGKVALKLRLKEGGILEILVRDWGVGIADVEQGPDPAVYHRERGALRDGLYHHGELHGRGKGALYPGEGDPGDHAEADLPPHRRTMNGTPTAPELLEAARQGDNRACEQVLEENAGLIWSIVRRYYGRGVEPDDLYQLGCLGFLKAVRGFDPSFGTQFSTYAVPKIAGEIRRFLRDDGTVKVSRGMKERGAAVWGARRRLVAEMGREPTLSELAAETGLTPEEIAAAETASDAVASLQAETGEGGLTLEGMLGTGGMEEDVVERLTLRSAMEELPERERQVLLLRYYKNLTQIQCARVLGVSQVQISRLERRAVDRLRKILCEEEVF